MDIRSEIRIEMEYEVLKPGVVLAPSLDLQNDEGVIVFVTLDQNPEWRRRHARLAIMSVLSTSRRTIWRRDPDGLPALITPDPFVMHVETPDAVGFR
jgi:lipopolysaccharide transport system ATP-binding protein